MGYLFWKDGRMQCPSCSVCGYEKTDEIQELVQPHPEAPKIRVIFLQCMSSSCQHKHRLGTFRYLGGHSFQRIAE